MQGARAIACPASLKGVLGAAEAAAALAEGLSTWADVVEERPVADGGEGTAEALHRARGGRLHEATVPDAFGRPRRARWLELPNGTAVVEAAEAIPLDPGRLDPLAASSRGFGELIRETEGASALLLCIGGVATVDGGVGMREVLDRLPAPARVAVDVRSPLRDAARLFGPQKGADAKLVRRLERRLAKLAEAA
ncbi:MAG: glycerate kinase, partial [Gaiellaceae bacterium]